jgi:hypothetical protein
MITNRVVLDIWIDRVSKISTCNIHFLDFFDPLSSIISILSDFDKLSLVMNQFFLNTPNCDCCVELSESTFSLLNYHVPRAMYLK